MTIEFGLTAGLLPRVAHRGNQCFVGRTETEGVRDRGKEGRREGRKEGRREVKTAIAIFCPYLWTPHETFF